MLQTVETQISNLSFMNLVLNNTGNLIIDGSKVDLSSRVTTRDPQGPLQMDSSPSKPVCFSLVIYAQRSDILCIL